jgi:hypothetical protein
VPASWWQGLCRVGPAVLRRMAGAPGVRALCDPSGRLALALWRGRRPAEVRERLGGRPVRRGPALPPAGDLAVLGDSWRKAVGRWCRRYARVGLADLVGRPGRLAVTPTHLDVLFDHRQADVRVRRAGLDLDPGWVPWFGRVVQFHYLYGEQADGE